MWRPPLVAHSFIFLRHGETDWNREKRTQGQIDVPLNAIGREQAISAATRLRDKPIERIVASPLARARETAELISATLSNVKLAFDNDLMEAHFGDLQGTPHDARNRAYWKGQLTPNGGETFTQFRDRIWTAMTRAVTAPNTLIVAHGGLWIAAQTMVAVSPAFRAPNATPLHVEVTSSEWTVTRLTDASLSVAGRAAPSDQSSSDAATTE